jgi:ribosomal protein S18 acetylase RimI-like enzyme
MGNRGRFGKYGETKRLNRLRQTRTKAFFQKGIGPERFEQSPPLSRTIDKRASVRVRLAKATEAGFITQLSRKAFNVYGPYEGVISRWFESKGTVTLVAFLRGRPVGFAMIGQLCEAGTLERVSVLLAIAVEPDKQRRGIGRMLLKEAERKAAEQKMARLCLHTAKENLSARRLFTANGYHPLGIERNFYPAGQDALVMFKEISE